MNAGNGAALLQPRRIDSTASRAIRTSSAILPLQPTAAAAAAAAGPAAAAAAVARVRQREGDASIRLLRRAEFRFFVHRQFEELPSSTAPIRGASIVQRPFEEIPSSSASSRRFEEIPSSSASSRRFQKVRGGSRRSL